ncbi:hypothetical protein WMY93_031585 [Mugilogobius chulae]|uniref:Metalloendopeptidase n=1 Tax=Mugilogobius chulae TaxID=88201 RepID=A0AAW0MMG8_9GOBI
MKLRLLAAAWLMMSLMMSLTSWFGSVGSSCSSLRVMSVFLLFVILSASLNSDPQQQQLRQSEAKVQMFQENRHQPPVTAATGGSRHRGDISLPSPRRQKQRAPSLRLQQMTKENEEDCFRTCPKSRIWSKQLCHYGNYTTGLACNAPRTRLKLKAVSTAAIFDHQRGRPTGAEPCRREEEESVSDILANVNKDISSRLMESDIMVDRRRNSYVCWFCTWSKYRGRVFVPVHVSSRYTAEEKQKIVSALKEIEAKTCVWFYHISSWMTWYLQHLYIYPGDGSQKVSLSQNGCLTTKIIQHEMLHALGFAHEHSRSDRDDYVRVQTQNIREGLENNFDKYDTNNLQTPYDFNSIMQYNNYAFSKNRSPTLVAIADPNMRFGYATEMSDNDVLRVNRLYSCKEYL